MFHVSSLVSYFMVIGIFIIRVEAIFVKCHSDENKVENDTRTTTDCVNSERILRRGQKRYPFGVRKSAVVLFLF